MYTFIVNNVSRDGQGKGLWQEAEASFLASFPDARVYYPQSPLETTALARQAAESGVRGVIAVGGEGTMNRVLQGLLAARRPDVALGVVPFGNVNDYTNNLGMRKDWHDALQVLQQGKTCPVGVVELRTAAATAYALNIADLGFGASTAQRHINGELALLKGRLKYNALALKTLLSWRNVPVQLKIDGDCIDADLTILLAGYSPTLGGFQVIPHAHVDNEKMAVTVAHDLSRGELIRLMQATKRHQLQESDKVRFYQASHIELRCAAPMTTQVDGEITDAAAQHIEMVAHPQRLQFFCP